MMETSEDKQKTRKGHEIPAPEREGVEGTGTAFVSPGNPLVGRSVWTWS